MRREWKRMVKCTAEDWKEAMTLRIKLGRRNYNYLRKTRTLPVPSLTALYRKFEHFKTPPGE